LGSIQRISKNYLMKILITGHKGFVGRHFVKFFSEQGGHEVVGVDIKDGGEDCRDFFKKCDEKFDLIIHLAAIVGGRQSIEYKGLSVATDLSIDSEMFNWALKTGQERIIYYSSCAAYPTKLQTDDLKLALKESTIDLDDVSTPDRTYGWSKLTGEILAKYARLEGLNVHVFRPWSGFGEDQDLDYPFPSFIDRVLRKVDDFEIWGSGEQVRDFIYISDIVKATMKAVELDIQEPLNLGSGIPTSFNQLAEIVFDVAKWRPKNGIKHLTEKPVGPMYRQSDSSKLQSFYSLEYDIEKVVDKTLQIHNWK